MSEWDPTEAAPGDNQSSDQSKSGLRQAWDAWSSRPENNAALLQFGIAMLQPRSPGQSGIGQFANALGEGAQASERNVAAQTEAANTEFTKGIKSREAGARETTANAYSRQVDQGGAKAPSGLQAALRAQTAFNTWARQQDLGLGDDPYVAAMKRLHPEISSKTDILANPQYRREALQFFSQPAAPGEEDDGSGTPSAPASSAPPAGPVRKTFYDAKGRPATFELQGGKWIPVQQ